MRQKIGGGWHPEVQLSVILEPQNAISAPVIAQFGCRQRVERTVHDLKLDACGLMGCQRGIREIEQGRDRNRETETEKRRGRRTRTEVEEEPVWNGTVKCDVNEAPRRPSSILRDGRRGGAADPAERPLRDASVCAFSSLLSIKPDSDTFDGRSCRSLPFGSLANPESQRVRVRGDSPTEKTTKEMAFATVHEENLALCTTDG
eukprot:2430065-Rhodomonas_salina.2